MAYDLQDIVDHTRRPLNDDDKVRWPDAVLLEYVVGGLQALRQKRPDLFLGYLQTDFTTLVLASDFPMNDDYREAVSQYATARAMFGEDESAVRGAAPIFYSVYQSTT
jgi:hypothetical protein